MNRPIILIFRLVILFAMALNYNFSTAQTLYGNVKDKKTDSPILYARVIIKNLDNGIVDSLYTNNLGNWSYRLITSVNDNSFIIPNDLQVDQNFPNPFNPSTRIQFSVPQDAVVEISVHNVLGELVDYKSQFLNVGNYSVNWISKGSAGVYFYTIRLNEQSLTKKMIQLDGGSGTGLDEIKSGIINYTGSTRKIQSIPVEITIRKFGYIDDVITAEVVGNEFFQTRLITVHSNSLMMDMHNDIMEKMIEDTTYNFSIWNSYNHTDIPRLQAGEVDVQFFALWVSTTYLENAYQRTIEMYEILNNTINQNQSYIQQAFSMEEAISINNQGKIAALVGVEGGHSIEESLEKLENLYNLGMRYMTITWNNSLSWAISAADPLSATVGLNEFGRDVIRKMDTLGVVVDVSHVGIKTIQDILEVTTNPIIATHSGVRTLRNHTRNLYDWQIRDIANSGGVVGIVFYPPFLTSLASAYIADFIKHIDYIDSLVGIDYVGIGSDFDGIGTNVVVGLEDVSKFPDLTMALLQHGYSQEEVEKILGGNFKRVFEQVENNSKMLKRKVTVSK